MYPFFKIWFKSFLLLIVISPIVLLASFLEEKYKIWNLENHKKQLNEDSSALLNTVEQAIQIAQQACTEDTRHECVAVEALPMSLQDKYIQLNKYTSVYYSPIFYLDKENQPLKLVRGSIESGNLSNLDVADPQHFKEGHMSERIFKPLFIATIFPGGGKIKKAFNGPSTMLVVIDSKSFWYVISLSSAAREHDATLRTQQGVFSIASDEYTVIEPPLTSK